jgi:hypothetical protein
LSDTETGSNTQKGLTEGHVDGLTDDDVDCEHGETSGSGAGASKGVGQDRQRHDERVDRRGAEEELAGTERGIESWHGEEQPKGLRESGSRADLGDLRRGIVHPAKPDGREEIEREEGGEGETHGDGPAEDGEHADHTGGEDLAYGHGFVAFLGTGLRGRVRIAPGWCKEDDPGLPL